MDTNNVDGKKEYSTPALERFGNLRDITLAVATHGALDNGRLAGHVRTH
jgi:hypothetical protein